MDTELVWPVGAPPLLKGVRNNQMATCKQCGAELDDLCMKCQEENLSKAIHELEENKRKKAKTFTATFGEPRKRPDLIIEEEP